MAQLVVFLLFVIFCLFGVAHSGWHLAWEDEFRGEDLYKRYHFANDCNGGGNNELQCYTGNRRENVRQENDMLILTARKERWGNNPSKQFTSARLSTKANFLHGKFEIRARLPKGKHLWPAFWMMPAHSAYGEWPKSGEIDILEYKGQKPNHVLGTIHFGEKWNNKNQSGTPETFFPVDFSQDFHVFGLDWSPTKIMWMVDGKMYHEESLVRNFWKSLYTKNGQPFDKNFFIILNLAVGGAFFGGESFDIKDADRWEKPTFEIDWLRKWE